jgi:two-component system response regulator
MMMEPRIQVEILLVEDNAYDAELTIRSLRKHHLANEILHLKDGEAALDFLFGRGEFSLRDVSKKPKVVLLDLKMPKVNGIEVLQQMRSDESTRKIPVVILTSSAEHPDIERCYALGANSYIVKPVEFENFSKAVSEIGLYWVLLNQHPG